MPGIYFCGAASLTAVYAVLWLALPRRRPGAFVAAGALAPFGFLGYVFVPNYWRPDHFFEVVPGVGVEDFLICFSEGGLAWLLAGYGRQAPEARIDLAGAERRGRSGDRPANALVRFLSLAGAGGSLALLGAACGLATMTAIVLGFTIVGLAIGAARRDLLPGALVAGPSFATLHVGVGVAVVAIWPESADFWNSAALTGVRTLGLPIEELAWALAFGACWPLFIRVTLVRESFVLAAAVSPAPEGGNAKSLSATGRRGFERRERRSDAPFAGPLSGETGERTRKKATSSSWRPCRLPSFPSSSS